MLLGGALQWWQFDILEKCLSEDEEGVVRSLWEQLRVLERETRDDHLFRRHPRRFRFLSLRGSLESSWFRV